MCVGRAWLKEQTTSARGALMKTLATVEQLDGELPASLRLLVQKPAA